MPYRAPLSEFRFLLDRIVGFDRISASARFAEAGPEMVEAIVAGRQPEGMTLPTLLEGVPVGWGEQSHGG